MSSSQKEFGRKLWEVMHRVAAGYPVHEDMPPSEKRTWSNRYLVFYQSLQFVLPTKKWRESLYYAMNSGVGKLDEAEMRIINASKNPKKALSFKIFKIHDTVRDALGLRVYPKSCYETWYKRYLASASGTRTNVVVPIDISGVRSLERLLETRDDPMNTYMYTKIPNYSSLRPYQKAEMRPRYLRDAATWWWKELAKKYPKETNARRRELVKAAFLARFQRTRSVPANTAKNVWARLPKLR